MRQFDRLIYLIYSVILPASLFMLAFYFGRPQEYPIYKNAKVLMGTIVEISVAACESRDKAVRAVKDATSEIERIEAKFSAFKNDSVTSRINSLKLGEMLDIDEETLFVLEESLRYYKMTEGAFDITVKPLVDLWGFSAHKGNVPAHSEIASALRRVGAGDIILDRANKRVGFAKDGTMVDLGGIVPGYATDRAVKVLKEEGIKNAIVNLGGDMYCLGKKGPRKLWKVGIQHPRERNKLIAELLVEDAAVVTSGDYENFFKVGDRRFCHIINPKTGMPVGDDPSSTTIIAKSSMEADALATAFMVLGYERGDRILNLDFDVDWVFIRDSPDGKGLLIRRSKGLEKRYDYKER